MFQASSFIVDIGGSVSLHIFYLLNLGGMAGSDYPEMKEYVVIVI